MANKYVDTSATYCGDGTLKTQAASAGAPGAWNDLLAVFDKAPAYGSVADGDVVYIRSANSGGAFSITDTGVTNINGTTVSSATITYIVDNGVEWAEYGVLTITGPNSTSGYFAIGNNVAIFGSGMTYVGMYSSTSDCICTFGYCYVQDFKFRSNSTGIQGGYSFTFQAATLMACTFECHAYYYNTTALFRPASYGYLTAINCTFDTSLAGGYGKPLFVTSASYGGFTRITGGRINPKNVLQALFAYSASYGGGLMISGLDFPKEMLPAALNGNTYMGLVEVDICNPPSRPFDFYKSWYHGVVDYIQGQNYPYLNAVLPDGSDTGWSFRVTPGGANVNKGRPLLLPPIQKFYNQAAAQQELTIEFLVNESFPAPTVGSLIAAFSYVNSSGESKQVETDMAVSSTAGWSATIYGAQSYTKYKLTAVTPDAVAENSVVTASVLVGYPPTNVGDFMFVDPDIGMEAT